MNERVSIFVQAQEEMRQMQEAMERHLDAAEAAVMQRLGLNAHSVDDSEGGRRDREGAVAEVRSLQGWNGGEEVGKGTRDREVLLEKVLPFIFCRIYSVLLQNYK